MLDLLATFLAVYREGSIRAGARAAGVSQPAASAQIRGLEESLGRVLFERSSTGVVPTRAADTLASEVSGPLDHLGRVLDRRSTTEGLTEEPFDLAGPSDLLAQRVVADLSTLVRQGLRLRIRTGLTDDLVDRLRRGGLDAVVALRRPRGRGLTVTPLADEELVLVAPPGTVEPLGAEDDPRRLDEAPLLAFDESLPLLRRFWSIAFRRQPGGTAVLTIPDLRAIRRACLAGAGLTVLPTYLVAEDLERGALVRVADVPDGVINTIWFVTKERRAPHPAEDAVRGLLSASARRW